MSLGLPLREGMARIVDGKVDRDSMTGKALKPEGWKAPDYAALVQKLLPLYQRKGNGVGADGDA